MSKKGYFHGGSALVATITLALAHSAEAQVTAQMDASVASSAVGANNGADAVGEIVVTGSYIGTRKDSALPVDVIGVADLKEQGSPTSLQIVKQITASTSGIGESNRYLGGVGTASVNLRGFGASRTLVLMNGRRLSGNAQTAFQGDGEDLNFIPQAALGRIEILKDGAAATYGSEAIGGVVNFITRRDLNGFEATADYSAVKDTAGEYRGSLAYGKLWDGGNLLLTAGYRHRSPLSATERDWAVKPFQSTSYGGYSGNSNPGNYVANTPAGAFLFRDNGCTELGGQLTNTVGGVVLPVNALSPSTTSSTCRFQITRFNDIVNTEDHYQLYGELNYRITDNLKSHFEVAWNRNSVPNERLSPSNGNTLFPTSSTVGGLSGSMATATAPNYFVRFNVPGNNPGLLDISGQTAGSSCQLTAAQCGAIVASGPSGVDISQTAFRFIASAGFPGHADGADYRQTTATAYRISGGFSGSGWFDTHWDTNLTYMKTEAIISQDDLLVDSVQAALNGYGSRKGAADQCTIAERTPGNAGNNAVGCYFFNPLSNSVAVSASNGQSNPFYRGAANPAVINNIDVLKGLYADFDDLTSSEIFVAEGVLNGALPIQLPGGPVEWALGVQYRYNRDIAQFGDYNNIKVYPCVDSVDDGTPACGAPSGPIVFFGSSANTDFNQSVTAEFTEIRVPILKNLNVTVAARNERFSNGLSTTNPKIDVKWQAVDWLAFRGSAGTTFRAPTAQSIDSNCAQSVGNLGGQYRAVLICGNPNLKPETADTYSVGVIVQKGGFNATLDYYLINLKGELTAEGSGDIFAAMFNTNHCDDPAYAALQARFVFTNGGCSAANVLRVDTFAANGPKTNTSGYDFRASYDWNGWLRAAYQVGVEATYIEKYERGAFSLLGAPQVVFAPATDRAGTHDLVSQYYSYPRTRANFWVNGHRGKLNLRYQLRFQEGTRAAINTPDNTLIATPDTAPGYAVGKIGKLKDFIQHDVTLQVDLPKQTQLTLSVQNLLNTDPSFAPSYYNYDFVTGNPLGRVFEVGLKKHF